MSGSLPYQFEGDDRLTVDASMQTRLDIIHACTRINCCLQVHRWDTIRKEGYLHVGIPDLTLYYTTIYMHIRTSCISPSNGRQPRSYITRLSTVAAGPIVAQMRSGCPYSFGKYW